MANGEPSTYRRAGPWTPFTCDASFTVDKYRVELKFVPKSWYRRRINPKGFEEDGRKALSFLFWAPVGLFFSYRYGNHDIFIWMASGGTPEVA